MKMETNGSDAPAMDFVSRTNVSQNKLIVAARTTRILALSCVTARPTHGCCARTPHASAGRVGKGARERAPCPRVEPNGSRLVSALDRVGIAAGCPRYESVPREDNLAKNGDKFFFISFY
jgi:hypothetical protein